MSPGLSEFKTWVLAVFYFPYHHGHFNCFFQLPWSRASLGLWEAVSGPSHPQEDLLWVWDLYFVKDTEMYTTQISLQGRTCHACCCECYQLKQSCLTLPKSLPFPGSPCPITDKDWVFWTHCSRTTQMYITVPLLPLPRPESSPFHRSWFLTTNPVSMPASREPKLWWALVWLMFSPLPITPQSTHTSRWCSSIHYSGSNRGGVTYFPLRHSTGF